MLRYHFARHSTKCIFSVYRLVFTIWHLAGRFDTFLESEQVSKVCNLSKDKYLKTLNDHTGGGDMVNIAFAIRAALTLVILILLVMFVAFFAGSETAFLSLTKVRVKSLLKSRGDKAAVRVAALKSNIDSLLSLILIGTNFCSSMASAIATALIVKVAGDGGGLLSTIIVTFFVTTFGQIIPKAEAIRASDEVALRNSKRLNILQKVLWPIVAVFSAISKVAAAGAAAIFGADAISVVTASDIKVLLDTSCAQGSIAISQHKMLDKVFRFSALSVQNIMTHRVLVKRVNISDSKETVIKEFCTTGKKVLAVMDDSIGSSTSCPIGTVFYKDILFDDIDEGPLRSVKYATWTVKSVMQEALFIPETLTLLECLATFKKNDKQIAFALDEQGDFSGIVTRDDILKVIFGSVANDSESDPMEKVRLLSANEFIVAGDMFLSDLRDILSLNIESSEVDTVGGFLLDALGHLPVVSESYKTTVGNKTVLFSAQEVVARRVTSVRIKIL